MKLQGLLLPAVLASYSASALEVGENICVEGFIMDFFCIDRGTLLDNQAVRTLEEPNLHSVHCLVDVSSCVNSPFEVLLDPVNDENSATTNLYSRGWRLSEDAKETVVALARDVGTSCSTCTGNGMLRKGFRAVMNATIVDLNEGAGIPATINVGEAIHSNDLGDDPCSVFGMENVLDAIANKTNSTFGISAESGRSKLQKQHLVHGSLMLISWGFLLPTGTLFGKFFKHRPDGLWFKVHIVCQVSGLLLAIIGWIIALVNFQVFADTGYNNYRHGILGMVVMCLGLFQPINAVLRPHAPKDGEVATTGRKLWEIAHKSLGYVALILAVVTISYGTTVLPDLDDQKTFQMAYGIGVGSILLLIFVALQVDKAKYASSTEPATMKQVEQEEADPEVDKQETTPLSA
jgi:hypothetical protein